MGQDPLDAAMMRTLQHGGGLHLLRQELGRDLDVSYKSAFVLAHNLGEAMAADQAKYQPKRHVEVDGAYFDSKLYNAG